MPKDTTDPAVPPTAKAVQHHRVRLATGKGLTGVTAISPEQRRLFEAIEVAPPTRRRLEEGV